MHLGDYQSAAFQFAEYKDTNYPVIAIGEELGELMEVFAIALDVHGDIHCALVDRVSNELGGILWNVSAICKETGLHLAEFEPSTVSDNLSGLILELGANVGTVQGMHAKAARKFGNAYEVDKCKLFDALGRVVDSIEAIAGEFALEIEDVAQANIDLLAQRKAAGTISAVEKRDE